MSQDNQKVPAHASKSLARLAAVQALYQASYAEQTPAQIVKDWIDQNFSSLRGDVEDKNEDLPAVAPDAQLFNDVVCGVTENQPLIDEMLAGALTGKTSSERMELLLRAVMRAGVFELHHHTLIPAGVIINDYVDVAKAFFNAKEPGLVNAVLDKIASKLR